MKSWSSDFLLDIRYPMYAQNKVVFERFLPTPHPQLCLMDNGVEHFLQYHISPFSTNETRYAVITRKMLWPYLKIYWLASMSLQ